MPKVGKTHYPYTKAGKTAAASARKAAARKEPKKKATPRRGRMGSRNMP
jgi:hypothetical protein